MKTLIVQLVYFGLFFVVAAELFLRIANIATDIPTPQRYDNGYWLYEAHQTGTFTRGYRGEVRTAFHINSSGWNSIRDYEAVDSNTIALIGDSFIEGFYVDVNQSIGRKIEQLTDSKYTVHEFAKAGANMHDYRTLYSAIQNKGYKAIFIHIGVKDLMAAAPTLTNKKSMAPDDLMGKIYKHLALMRYVNVNMHFGERFNTDPQKSLRVSDAEVERKLQALAPQRAIYLYEDKRFDAIHTDLELVPITHRHRPYHYGFNKHWNENGALNVAETIVRWL